MGSKLLYSSSYHPHTYGHTVVVNRSHQNLLIGLSGENPSHWDMVLAQDEFSYNDLMNKSTGKSPFHIVYGRSPKGVVDLIMFPYLGERNSDGASDFADNIQEMHEHVKQRFQQSNAKYKRGKICRGECNFLRKVSW